MANQNPPTAKLQDHSGDGADAPAAGAPKPDPAKAPAALEEDDEFEDFPVEGTPPAPSWLLRRACQVGNVHG